MKKLRRCLAGLLALLLLTTAAGCGAASMNKSADTAAMTEAVETPMEPAPEIAWEEPMDSEDFSFATAAAGENAASEAQPSPEDANYAEKIIYSGHVYLETTEFDQSVAALEQAVKEYNGFVQDSSVDGSTRNNADGTTSVVSRWGYYTVRIPSSRFDEFMAMTGQLGNVTSSGRTAENVTSQYTDYEARLSSLKTQEERLLDMLEKSEDLDSLIQLESRLSEVRYEIESIEQNLRNLDQRLSYSTVSLELREVEIYTPTATAQRSFGQKLGDALSDGWQSFTRGLQNLTVGLAYLLPVLVLLAAAAAVVILIVRRVRRKKKARRSEPEQEEQ